MKPITNRQAKQLIKKELEQEEWNLNHYQDKYNATVLRIEALESQITSKY